MSTLAQVRAAWDTKIWANAAISAITDKIFGFDLNLVSTKEVARLRYNQEVNFFLCLITKAERLRPMGQVEQTFTAEVRYYRNIDTSGANFAVATDAIETVSSLVDSQLGATWNSTVDFPRRQEGPLTIKRDQIASNPVWVATYKYLGIKNI